MELNREDKVCFSLSSFVWTWEEEIRGLDSEFESANLSYATCTEG